MQNQTIARRYATAIFELAKAGGRVEPIGRDLRSALDALAADEHVQRYFTSPVVDRGQKSKILRQAFDRSFDRTALNSILLLVRKRRETLFGPIVAEYDKLALADRRREPLEISTARQLPPEELAQIVARLSRHYGKSFEVSQTLEPELLGGVRITMGGRRIDGSIAGRLDDFARELFATQQKESTR